MKHNAFNKIKIIFIIVTFFLLLFFGYKLNIHQTIRGVFNSNKVEVSMWYSEYDVVEINSSLDNNIQKAIVFKSNAIEKKPVVISLHTWSSTFDQDDYIHEYVKAKNWNYIHPNFRGANNTFKSCASDYVISDIEDAISYAISHLNADPKKIHLIGVSGGAYATLAMFIKSKYDIATFAAWCPISDLEAWYYETKNMNLEYALDILKCTNSSDVNLDKNELRKRSPLYWNLPHGRLDKTKLKIYAGVFDGVTGSVPITHSIHFYNKILNESNCENPNLFISKPEKDSLLLLRNQYEKTPTNYLGKRKILLQKQYKSISLTIFDGSHEILTDIAINELEHP